MASIDSRIVSMKFENKDFIDGIKQTSEAFGKLNKMFDFKGNKQQVDELNDSVKKLDMNPLTKGVEGVSKAFVAMSTIAITALANITNRVVDAGLQMAKSLTLEPLIQGYQEYELKMGSIQTIMAGSGASLEVVNKKLQELNTYADRTIYSFADMTTNIGKFTNAGVSLDDSVAAIQGVANVAAVSGANANEASRAMYNFAQALSKGYVQLIDWKSIELANMGTVEFKQQLIDAAEATGTLTKQGDVWVTKAGTIVSATQNFNESLTDQWMTTEVLTDTLKNYSDETTEIGKKAFAAAQDVKTFTQLLDTVKEAIGSGWAETFEIIIGNFEEAKELYTGINNVIDKIVGNSADARNKLLGDWKELGGRTALIDAFKNIFSALGKVLETVGKAFRDVFPAMTGKTLADMTNNFKKFTETLKPSAESLEKLRSTLRGVFAIFSIVKQVVMGVVGIFAKLFGAVLSGSGGFLSVTGSIGDFLYSIDQALKKGDALKNFFSKLGDVISAPVAILSALGGLIGDLFSKSFGSGLTKSVEAVTGAAEPLDKFFTRLSDTFDRLGLSMERLKELMKPVIAFLKDIGNAVMEALANSFSGTSIGTAVGAANAGMLGFVGLMLKKISGGLDVALDITGGGLDSIKDALSGLTGVMEGMQANLKAEALLKIAGAIGILALALAILAGIDPVALTKAMTGVASSMAILVGALRIMSGISTPKEVAKLGVMSAALVLLATAILIMAKALKTIAELSFGDIVKGLVGLAGALGILMAAIKPMQAGGKGMIRTGFALIVLATGLRIMAESVAAMGRIPLGEIAKGLAGIAGALVIMINTLKAMPTKGALISSAAILVMATALNILAEAVTKFGAISLGDTVQGLFGMAAALLLIIAVMKRMPKDMLLKATGLLVVSGALVLIAKALNSMGSMSVADIAKGLTALAGSLAILALGLMLMQGTMSGAAALIVAATAVMILTPALIALGSMPFGAIVKALVAMAAAFALLGAAGLLLAPVAPALLALGAAVALLGAGVMMAGIGILAFAKALDILVTMFSKNAEAARAYIEEVIEMIPRIIKAFGEGILELIRLFANSQAEITAMIATIFGAVLDAIIKIAPKLQEAIRVLLDLAIAVIREFAPKFIALGGDLTVAMIQGLADRMPEMIDAGTELVVAFILGIGSHMKRVSAAGVTVVISLLNGIASNAIRLVDAGFRLILDFINAMTKAVNQYMPQIREASRRLGIALIDGFTGGLYSKAQAAYNAARDIASKAANIFKAILGIRSPSRVLMGIGENTTEGFGIGLLNSVSVVKNSADAVADEAISSIRKGMKDIIEIASEEIDINPVITPVIDLDQIRSDAEAISDIVGGSAIDVSTTYSKAASISTDKKESESRYEEKQPPVVEFTQNNYSPKALSSIEIYRNTRNQLSMAKEAMVA